MADMLTAKEMQALLQVDRSTIYRMAEAGQLPAIKVGKQWRFPGDTVEQWLKGQAGGSLPASPPRPATGCSDLAAVLPLDCVQLIQDAFAEILGVMLIVTDMTGQPITAPSNLIPLYSLLTETNNHAICRQHWQQLGQIPALEPRFVPGLAGILCARALVRLGNELKGMVIAFGVAPQPWPPAPDQVADLAGTLRVEPARLQAAFASLFVRTPAEQKQILVTLQRIADIIAHISSQYSSFLERLENIARLSMV